MQPHFRVVIMYSSERPREQSWKCVRCRGGGRKFRKEARATRLLVKQMEKAWGQTIIWHFSFSFLGTSYRSHYYDPWWGMVAIINYSQFVHKGTMNGLYLLELGFEGFPALSLGSVTLSSLPWILLELLWVIDRAEITGYHAMKPSLKVLLCLLPWWALYPQCCVDIDSWTCIGSL